MDRWHWVKLVLALSAGLVAVLCYTPGFAASLIGCDPHHLPGVAGGAAVGYLIGQAVRAGGPS